MIIPAQYTLNTQIVTLLNSIASNNEIIKSAVIPPEIEINLRRQTTLHSALFSARIEGSTATIEELTPGSKIQKKAEVFQILKAVEWMRKTPLKDISLDLILKLHSISMKGLNPDAGKFRNEVNAIFNSAGIAVYMPPPPTQMNMYLKKLIKFAGSESENFAPIRAALVHYSFEKIHPFLDGNGRVGRLLFQKVLMQSGYDMRGLLSVESYIDKHRAAYYQALDEPEKEATDYVLFMLEALEAASAEARKLVERKEFTELDTLLPRRGEMLRIAKEQKIISTDMISRRFLSVNKRTIRNDIAYLVSKGFLTKLGTTRGVFYQAKQ